jgi:hypothetical protein
MDARDAHRSATVLTLLVILWGAVSLVTVPWEPFWIPNLGQVIVCVPALVYFLRTWGRPQPRIANAFSGILIAYALVILPWIAIAWSGLGRPWEAFTVPQLATVCTALIFPRRLTLGVLLMALFAAEGAFVYVYARHVGLDALVPVSEPLATFGFTVLGIGLFVLRRHRRDLTKKHIRVQAEIQALDRLRPLLSNARDQLDAEAAVLAAEIQPGETGRAGAISRSMCGAIGKLGDLGGKLGNLLADAGDVPPIRETEQRLLARDSQFGATVLVAMAAVISIPTVGWSHFQLHDSITSLVAANTVLDWGLLIYLVSTRHRPSRQRALWAGLAVFVFALAISSYNQVRLLELDRPYAPFLAHKLFMVTLGLTVTTRYRLGVVCIVTTAVTAMALWFALDLGNHRDLIPLAEPSVTLCYMLIGLITLKSLEQRRIASIQLLRADAEASALHRRALMFLSLRDRLNSPLQTLVLGTASPNLRIPEQRIERVHVAVDRLVALSRELAGLDMHIPPAAALGFDADAELRRRV